MVITLHSLYVSEENIKVLEVVSTGDSVEPILFTQAGDIIRNIKS